MRVPRNHVFIIDGTLSRVDDQSCLTHAARLNDLLSAPKMRVSQTVGYDRGIQKVGYSKWIDAAVGRGFNNTVIAGYATLASRYEPGDRIFLFGFSRGAYAVRSIAGMIDRVGLLKKKEATERRVRLAFRYYKRGLRTHATKAFRRIRCHRQVDIACVGAWDTVKALGLPYPLLSRFFPMATEFHDHNLCHSVGAAYHALAADETRTAYAPVLWACKGWKGPLEQVWFPGAHGDIGGERGCLTDPTPLTNFSFVWMVERAIRHGLIVPDGWKAGFPTDCSVPMVGSYTGIAKFFLFRCPRRAAIGIAGQDVHPSLFERIDRVPKYCPKARGLVEHRDAQPVIAPSLAPETALDAGNSLPSLNRTDRA